MNTSSSTKRKEHLNKLIEKARSLSLKKKIAITLVLVLAIAGTVFLVKDIQHKLYTRAYKVYCNEKLIGVVREKSLVKDIVNDIKVESSKDYGVNVNIREDKLKYEESHAEDNELTSKKELRQNILKDLKLYVSAYAIEVDGKEVGIVKTKDLAQNILDKVKEPYIKESEDIKVEDIKFVEDVKIVKKEVPISKIQEDEEVLKFIKKGTTEEKIHIVTKGESFWSIAHKYGLTVKDLEKANPNKDAKLIHPGDKLSLIVPKPYITVATYENVKYVEKIPFDVEVKESSAMYKDQVRIKRRGIPGEKEVKAKVIKHNGIEVAKEILKETILSQPVAQIILKGTKELPPLKGTGSFITPTRGRLTSGFGYRWGRMHEGIDLAARVGTPIKAADGGVVTYAGWRGNYGYMVEIDHGGGFKTRYAHCSKIYVKKGQKVYKGKTIAAVGNTGRSTGPHLHFEVRKHGVPQNPYKYLGKKYR
ncbi:peptidoglycan DD-metalloendopeptidase family protein [Thermohalobacter berrensis]|uniref:Peptidase M23 n=1 Tax=Thermohalobacter berrensis TaxID=99594 RepID=A0A419T3G8_9FIRM|nr:peptidoglycan DD-metalloendopeptidase family protein [Thermohalobacter berrensis]RKD32094.1 hypothetical protein BET03_11530 [Thermohalobacter berrensis]